MKNLKTCLYEKLNIHKINIPQKKNFTCKEFCNLMQDLINDNIDSDDLFTLENICLQNNNINVNDLQFDDITTNNAEENFFVNCIRYKAKHLDQFNANYCIKHGSGGYFLQYANVNIKNYNFKRRLPAFRYAYLSDDLETYRIFKPVYDKK